MVFMMDSKYEYIPVKSKRYPDGVLLVNDYGNWCFISDAEFRQYKFRDMSPELIKKLKENYMIVDKGDFSSLAHRFNDFYWYMKEATRLHIVVPTLRCNFTCKYCYAFREPIDKTDKDMTPETMDKTIDFIHNTPEKVITIEFTGGEPLLRFDLVKRAIERSERLSKENGKDVKFALITNAAYLTEEIVDFFVEKKNTTSICLSLDGPKQIQDYNRKVTSSNDSSYEITIDALNKLKEKGYPSLTAMPVVTKTSLENWKEIVDEYVKQGFGVLRFKYVSRFGYAIGSWKKDGYTAEEFLEGWKSVVNYMIELNKKGIQIAEQLTILILIKFLNGINPNYAEMISPCGAIVTQLLYDYDGSIFPCDEARTKEEFKIGDVFNSSYDDLLNHSVTKTMSSMSNLSTYGCDNACPWSAFCGICPLEIYMEKNGFVSNIHSNYRHKIHLGMFEFIMDKILHNEEEKKILEKWIKILPGIPDLYEDDESKRNIFREAFS